MAALEVVRSSSGPRYAESKEALSQDGVLIEAGGSLVGLGGRLSPASGFRGRILSPSLASLIPYPSRTPGSGLSTCWMFRILLARRGLSAFPTRFPVTSHIM